MPPKSSNPFFALMQRIAASPPGAWLYAHTLHHVDKFFLRLSGGHGTISSLATGLPIVIVTTTGARSGLARTSPLLCIRDQHNPSSFAIIATNWGQARYPAWYFNLKAHPIATCAINGISGQYQAHEAAGDEYARFWQYAADTYLGYPLYKQRIQGRNIPIMVMISINR